MSRALALVDSADESRNNGPRSVAPPLLETKLYAPRPRSALVARPRLIELLGQDAPNKLTLVVAPAGFGKTTFVATWLAGSAGWVSLDPSENEPRLFWFYVIRAVQKVHPAVGPRALALLQSPQAADIESVLTTLINDVVSVDADLTLVLDDYHVIDDARVHDSLTFLLDHLPPRMHVVITSRSEPPVALPRLRARGELRELRASDLRFSHSEASAFFSQVMALELSPSDLATLEQRTEGWIAGLKLAALSMKGREDTRAFIDAFSGDNRHIADYLIEEVLRSEPEPIRRLLLGTAMLDRLSGPLCDAVLGQEGSQLVLEDLERRGLFVIALDDRRERYRYHHLFADVLQKQAIAQDPEAVRACHARASVWYEQHGSSADAIRHAFGAADPARAAALLERNWPERDRSYESAAWLARVKSLPDGIVRDRPVLTMGYAWALLNSGELEAAELRLRDVEQGSESPGRMVVNDQARFESLFAELGSARIYLAQALGDVPGTLEHATRALELIPEHDHAGRATGIALVALARWGRGELEQAHRTFADALAAMRAGGHELDAIRGTFVLGDIRVAQGRLREAAQVYERGLLVAAESPHGATAETDELHLGLSELHREWNDLASATSHLEAIARSATRAAHTNNRLRWCTSMAKVREAQGAIDDALELLGEAANHERRDPIPRVRPIPALKARLFVAQGRVDEAADWARKVKLSVNDDVSYLREFEQITFARILIAQRAPHVVALLDRLASAAQAGGRVGSVIEILVTQSLAQQALGNMRGALERLTQAVTLAEPEGYLRVFLDEGARVRELLRQAATRGLAVPYLRRVLAAFDAPPKPIVAPGASPVQPLTTRELEILRLIATGLRNQEIADRLSISAATVKRHIANAYGKLGVKHRTEALARAAELKLL
jgi:LuxR family maltose regulon positive regulatory protein